MKLREGFNFTLSFVFGADRRKGEEKKRKKYKRKKRRDTLIQSSDKTRVRATRMKRGRSREVATAPVVPEWAMGGFDWK